MAKIKLSLVWNKETRKRDIIVDYISDAGALPMEHEADHKDLINKLIEGGLLKAEEAGLIISKRESESPVDLTANEDEAQNTRESVKKES